MLNERAVCWMERALLILKAETNDERKYGLLRTDQVSSGGYSSGAIVTRSPSNAALSSI